ncbi:HAD-IIB family hydrolase [Candidatus Aminicenantes bacterium AH-873-B07]|nr:HAD-IIB family hydrolase [Candidatus Aminicenantes bacterium AH-873-B07]
MIVIFSDVDGTLLDQNYSFKKAEFALKNIKKRNIPLVLCSSKTYDEMIYLRRKMKNKDPFIVENGGAIFIPKKYFKKKFHYSYVENDFKIIELFEKNISLRDILNKITKEININIVTIDEMNIKRISQLTGLSEKEAELVKRRKYSMPFLILDSEEKISIIEKKIKENGLYFTQGEKFYYITTSTKGKATNKLIELFENEYNKKIISIGIGDSFNDLPLLETVNIPILMRKLSGKYEERINLPNLIKTDKSGPEGWGKILTSLLMKNLEV